MRRRQVSKLALIRGTSVVVFAVLRAQIRVAVGKVLRSVRTTVREASRPTPLVTGFFGDIDYRRAA